jgi:hypothetical protein
MNRHITDLRSTGDVLTVSVRDERIAICPMPDGRWMVQTSRDGGETWRSHCAKPDREEAAWAAAMAVGYACSEIERRARWVVRRDGEALHGCYRSGFRWAHPNLAHPFSIKSMAEDMAKRCGGGDVVEVVA